MSDSSTEPRALRIPHTALEAETLVRLIEEFVTREGTDYSHADYSLSTKVEQVRRQIERGEAVIVYEAGSATCHIVRSTELRHMGDADPDE